MGKRKGPRRERKQNFVCHRGSIRHSGKVDGRGFRTTCGDPRSLYCCVSWGMSRHAGSGLRRKNLSEGTKGPGGTRLQ